MALWKNLPSEDTPINARNLSRSERYIEAVAGANGDFFVNIDGAGNLEAGDIVRISFPTATDGSANARLSIDGASGTFRNFQMGTVDLLAEELEERNITCYYNGTTWEFVGGISGVKNIDGDDVYWNKHSNGFATVYRVVTDKTTFLGTFSSSSQGLTWHRSSVAALLFPFNFIDLPTVTTGYEAGTEGSRVILTRNNRVETGRFTFQFIALESFATVNSAGYQNIASDVSMSARGRWY